MFIFEQLLNESVQRTYYSFSILLTFFNFSLTTINATELYF